MEAVVLEKKDVLNINSSTNINKIEVYNILGQQQKIQSKYSNEVNVSSLSNGVYFLKLYQDNNTFSTKRFIKALQQFTTESLPIKSWDEYQ